GGTDVYARILAQALAESLKQQFIVDNRPGASGNIGAAAAARSAADGYTFLVSANPALAVNPSLYKELPYNAERDFTPVTRGVMAPMALVVHPSVPAKTLAELVVLGKTAPGKLAYGSAGTGSPTFLGVRMLEEGTGARFTHVPYKGVGAAYADLLGGQVQFLFPDVASAISHLKAGKLRALAVTQSTALLPGTPTFAEAGFPLEVITSFSASPPRSAAPCAPGRWRRSSRRRCWCRSSTRPSSSPPASRRSATAGRTSSAATASSRTSSRLNPGGIASGCLRG